MGSIPNRRPGVGMSMGSLAIPGAGQKRLSPSSGLFPDSGILLGTSPFDFIRKDQVTVDVYYNGVPVKQARADGAAESRSAPSGWARLAPSLHAQNTINPIRRIVDVMSIKPNPNKDLIKLHLGDPTLTGTLNTSPVVEKALADSLESGRYNGYGPAVGLEEVRVAVAESATLPAAPVTAEDVILTSGCSHALQLAIEVLANPGDNILVPRPGFPLYSTLMNPHGVEDRKYNLLMDKGWDMDLEMLESLIDSKTRAIVVNNPSNPCGAVYSKEHLEAVLAIAERHHLPIIADEIYGGMTFGAEFHPLASLSPQVPILVTDGIAKRFLVPGWRLGWLIVHDRHGAFTDVRQGLKQLATKIVGPCAVVQGAVPAILRQTPQSFFDDTKALLKANSEAAFAILKDVVGLRPVMPQGAMYMMVGLDMSAFPDLEDELELTKALIAEESLYCLPGAAFHFDGAIRLVMTYPLAKTQEACLRLRDFCDRHFAALPPKAEAAAAPAPWDAMDGIVDGGDENSRDADLRKVAKETRPKEEQDVLMVTLHQELNPGLTPSAHLFGQPRN